MIAGDDMIKIGALSATLEPEQGSPEKPKERIPLMAIPVTLAIGLLVAGGYIGNRIFASRGHATPIAKPLTPTAAQAPGLLAEPGTQSTVAPLAIARRDKPSPLVPVNRQAAAPPDSRQALTITEPRPQQVNPAMPEGSATGLIEPRRGERYLQIAAISADMVSSFMADLKKYNVQASVAPGPHDGLVRIVIGPFSDWDSVAHAKDQIQSKWPDCFVRLY